MKKCQQILMFIALAISCLSSQSAQHVGYKHPALKGPEILEVSKQYSRQMVEQNPLLGEMLDQLGFQYLHDLDPTKLYVINEQTREVRISTPEIEAAGVPNHITDNSANIITLDDPDAPITGRATASVFCAFSDQMASVRGFMSTQQERDPRQSGIREGFLSTDTATLTVAEVNFALFKQPRGAKNPSNVTVMQTTHQSICNGEQFTTNLVSSWPPLRVDVVIDDTGSMGSELAGAKSALSDFINSHNTDPEQIQRGVSYEVISFKDSPTLRLANTEDSNAAINTVNSLFASGGGDCPEDSLGALNLALDNLTGDENSAGEIVLVTDASPRGGSVDGVISQAQDLGIKVNVMLSGDCVASSAASSASLSPAALAFPILSARDVFQRIANETGGLYFYKPNGTASDYKKILAEIFETAVKVSDTTPPVVTVNASPTLLWPPNHKMIHIDTEVLVTDDQDSNPVTKFVGVTVNEPDDGQGDGNTAADIQITENGDIYLRAERSGSGNGRFYTITYQATDKSGNVGFGTVDVGVPHNQ